MKSYTRFLSVPAAVAAIALAISACGGGSSSVSRPVSSTVPEAAKHFSTLSAGNLDAAKTSVPSHPVLDLTGRIAQTNGQGLLSIDLGTLERMQLVTGSVYEPFVKKRTTFSGVLLSDLLTAARASDAASSIFITALDDYTWTLPIDLARSGEVLLATRENGEPIPVEQGGPIRIVFSDDSTAGKNTDSWVWSVRGIEVR